MEPLSVASLERILRAEAMISHVLAAPDRDGLMARFRRISSGEADALFAALGELKAACAGVRAAGIGVKKPPAP